MEDGEIVSEETLTTTKNGREFIYEIKLISKKIRGIKQFNIIRRWYYSDSTPPVFKIDSEWSWIQPKSYEDKIAQKLQRMNYKRKI